MRVREAALKLVSLLVPPPSRSRWLEEWRAEIQYGGWRMLPGALPDALAIRRLAARAPRPGALPRSSRNLFHAIDQDVRYSLRALSSGRSFTFAVTGSLAIGIAATTTAFAIVNATLFRPYPGVLAQDELVRITLGPRARSVWYHATWDEVEAIRQGVPALESLALAHGTTFAAAPGGNEAPRTVGGLVVSTNYFDVLGVKPAIGRFFLPDDETAARPAVIVSHSYWQGHLAGDPSVLERSVSVNGRDLPIIGVAPEGFGWVFTRVDVDLWIPFAQSDLVFRDGAGRPVHARAAGPFDNTIIGRLNPSATIEQASAQAAGLSPGLAERREARRDLFVRVQPLRIVDPARYAPHAAALMAVPLIVLAIACVNAANLLLARASRRSSDWLVRLALGASRWRLTRQLLVESILLALDGAALGLAVSFWTIGFFQHRVGYASVVIDVNVVGFVVCAALATALVFGLGPALSVTRAAVSRAPAAGRFMTGPFGSRARAALVMLQAALCLGLLATGAQFTNTLRTLSDEGLPEPEQFLRASFDLDKLRYSPEQSVRFYANLLERVQQLPPVRAAALANKDVLGGLVGISPVRVWVPGRGPDPRPGVVTMYTAGEYFDAVGLPVVQGRRFTADEQRASPRAVIVNQPFAEDVFGGDALGRALRIGVQDGKTVTAHDVMIVGVVAAPSARRTDSLPTVFYPAPLQPEPALDFLVRFEGEPEGVAAAIRTVARSIDNRVPVERIVTGEELRRLRNAVEYNLAQALSVLGIVALALAAAGLYGVVSYMITMRQKEIGIRMALGADGGSVFRLVLQQSIVPVVLGCAIGAIGTVIVGSVVRSRLYGASPVDPLAFGSAVILLLATMTVASLAPARRASRVNPVEVLKAE